MTNVQSPQGVDPLMTCKQAAEMLAISVPTFHRRVREGVVPKPVKLGRLARWLRSELVQVVETAKAAR